MICLQKYRGKRDRTTVNKLVKLTDDGWESEVTHSQLAEQFVELVRTCKFGYQKDIAPVLGVSESHLSKKVIPFAKLYGMIEDKEIQDCFAIARGEAPTFEEDPDY